MYAVSISSGLASEVRAEPNRSTHTHFQNIICQPGESYHSLTTQSGKIIGASNASATKMSTQSGNILVGTSSNVEHVSSQSGDVRAESLAKVGVVSTQSGDVLLGSGCEVTGNVSTATGDVTLGEGMVVHGGGVETQMGDILVGTRCKVMGNVSAASGTVTLREGAVVREGSVQTTFGNILVGSGCEVAGDISTTGGDVMLEERANVHGGIHVKRPQVCGGFASNIVGVAGGAAYGGSVFVQGMGIQIYPGSAWGGVAYPGGVHKSGNSHVTVRSGSDGSTVVLADPSQLPARQPHVVIGPEAVVKGPLKFELPVRLCMHDSARTGPVTGAVPPTVESWPPRL